MLDINLLRRDLPGVIERLQTRKQPQPFLDVERFKSLEGERKTIQTRTEDLQARRDLVTGMMNEEKPMRCGDKLTLKSFAPEAMRRQGN